MLASWGPRPSFNLNLGDLLKKKRDKKNDAKEKPTDSFSRPTQDKEWGQVEVINLLGEKMVMG